MASFVGEVNTSTEGTLWAEELPSSFLQIMWTWSQGVKESIHAAVKAKCLPQSPSFKTVLAQCLDTIKTWDEETKSHTVLQTLQLGNPRAALLYEYCFLRYVREVKTLHIDDAVLAIRATMFDFIDFAVRDRPTNVPLLDGLAEEF
jgi:hypothetical protein